MDVLKVLFAIPYYLLKVAVTIIRAKWSLAKWAYERFKGRKKLTTHGDASWATDQQLRKAGALTPGGFLLGFTKSKRAIYSKPNRGALVLAGPGQGKSQIILANFRAKKALHLSQRQHIIVHDPAGELHALGGPMLRELGYLVEKVDLITPENGIGYDVQSYLKPGTVNFGSDLRSLSELLVAPEPNSRQPHFVEYARKMLMDVIVLNILFEGGKKSLPECVAELLNDDRRDKMLKRMKKHAYDFNALEIFNKMSGPEGVGMLSTALRKLDPWTLENIQTVSVRERDDGRAERWTFEQMFNADQPCALFVRTGLSPGGGDFARVVFGNAVNTIRRSWDATGHANPRGTQVFIDEAAKLGKCVALIDGHNELRKANYSQLLSYVSFAAMKESFGADADTLFNGCDHIILPGNQDMQTNDMYSRMIGDMTIESGSRSENEHGASTGKNEQARRLIKGDEIRRATYGRAFAVAGGLSVDGLNVFEMKKGKPAPRLVA
jgi:type IV secretion system protein VirD4